MPNWVTNRITLCGTDQKQIEELFEFFKSDNGDMDFNKIVEMPEEIKNTESSSVSEDALVYYLAKGLGKFERVDDILTYEWCKEKNIITREELFAYWEKEHSENIRNCKDNEKHHIETRYETFFDYGKHLYELEQKYGLHDWYIWSVRNWKCKWNAWDAMREENILEFYTAWVGVPHLILMASEKFPEVIVNYEFADENFGCNLGRYVFRAGEIIAEYEPEDDSREAKLLAKQILGEEAEEEFKD